MREARYGSLPWFAGIFWFMVGSVFHGAAWGAFYIRDGISWATLRLADAADKCMKIATKCAREAGAED